MKQQTPPQEPQRNLCQILNYAFRSDWKLGSGNFATVFKGIDTNNQQFVAIKVIDLKSLTSKVSITLLKQQILLLKQLNHQNVIRFIDVINSQNNCYIVTEFCKYGDLQTLLKMKGKFGEDQISMFVYQIYKALKYLAQKQIVHRDLKPANIFINQQHTLKIADFGFAIKINGKIKDLSLGSPFYMSPQSIHCKQYGPKTDVWAFGTILYELICGYPPLIGCRSKQQLQERILMPIPNIKQTISAQLRSFIQRCLVIQQKYRISVQEMQMTPYMQKILKEYEGSKNNSSSSFSQTKYSSKSSCLIYKTAMRKPISYEQSVSMLQYCRLLSKICQFIPEKSNILQQWLLITIKDLHKARIKNNTMFNYDQFQLTIKQYYQRYKTQFKQRGTNIKIDEVLVQCQRLMEKHKNLRKHLYQIHIETILLKQALNHPLKLVYFAKKSTVTQYLNKASQQSQ